ncbi:MAG: lysophospholipid acyltransferase family protein [Kiloniellales bacterium]
MTALRSLLFNGLFFTWSSLMHLVSLPALLLPRRVTLVAGAFWVRVVLWLLAVVCGLRYEVRGREHLPEGPCIIASKHQSAWDTLIWSQLLDDPSYVLKRELVWVPLFGWFLAKSGVVAVDRSGGATALRRLVRDAQAKLEQGRPLVIFPEGTRTPPGSRRPYHPGVAALYVQLGVPVVPVALNSGLYWGRRSFHKRPGRIVLEFLPPIPPGLSRRAFLDELHERIESASDRLCREAGPPSPASENKARTVDPFAGRT